ncbi:MAG: hypothetical protein J5744_06330 [Oscillospiraceae bacterium]|nr:hypothetical protein [Oscillospiraceae bacterium]
MGILDDLLKKGAQGLVTDIAQKVSDTLSETLGVDLNAMGEEIGKEEKKETNVNEGITVPVSLKLRNILGNQFPGYTFAENVNPSAIGGPSEGMPYSFVVSDATGVKLLIMIIGRNTCTHKDYKYSRSYAEYRGIQFINFIEHFENTVPYITERLRNYL